MTVLIPGKITALVQFWVLLEWIVLNKNLTNLSKM